MTSHVPHWTQTPDEILTSMPQPHNDRQINGDGIVYDIRVSQKYSLAIGQRVLQILLFLSDYFIF